MEQNTVEREVSLEPFSFCVSALKAQEADPQVLWGFGCWAYSPFLHQTSGPRSDVWHRSHWAQPAGLPGLGAL